MLGITIQNMGSLGAILERTMIHMICFDHKLNATTPFLQKRISSNLYALQLLLDLM